MTRDRHTWTDEDFETMSWHDNHVHGIGLRSGEYGMGVLTLDLDYILEWIGPVLPAVERLNSGLPRRRWRFATSAVSA